MRFRSIRWTLLFWYAVIIAGSLAALGWALHTEMRRTLYRDADAQLGFSVSTALHKIEEYPAAELPGKLAASLPPGATFAVWDVDGRRIAASPGFEARAVPRGEEVVTSGHFRGLTVRTPGGGWLLVNMNVRDQHHRIREFLIVLLVASAAIVVVGLGGGWLLVTRALRPLDHIGDTARRISADNLSERIDTEHVQNELGGLAQTLNKSFDRLEAAFARQARFTADASHELRTPLAIQLSHLELAETQARTEEQLRERLGICRDAAQRMRSVVEGLLTLARADAGEQPLDRAEVDVADLLEEVHASIAPLASGRGITIEHRLEPTTVFGDRERLREVATNLYSNAVHHNHDDGRVIVTLGREDHAAVLRVKDFGPGIPDADQNRIFERFFRVDKARSRGQGEARSSAQGGSGLGLAIVRWIVELHGGSISVQSRLTEGAEFTVRIPLSV